MYPVCMRPGSGVADGYELPCQCLILITLSPSVLKKVNSDTHMMPMLLKSDLILLCGQHLVLTQLPLLGTLVFVRRADSIGLVFLPRFSVPSQLPFKLCISFPTSE